MKKILGILGIVMFAIMLFYNTESVNNTQKSNLIEMNIANAISELPGVDCNCTLLGKCKASGSGAHCAEFPGNGNCQDYNGNC